MSDPERRKQLQELRRRRLELQKQLQTTSTPAVTTSAEEKSVNEIAKEALESAKKVSTMQTDAAIQDNAFMNELLKRKFNQSLGEVSFFENFIAKKPEMYDEVVQCEQFVGSDSDNEVETTKQQKKVRGPLIIRKHVITNNQQEEQKDKVIDTRPKVYTVVPEGERKAYLDKKKEEIGEVISNKKKIVERALNERGMVEIFRREDCDDVIDNENNGDSSNKNKTQTKTKSNIFPLCDFFDEACSKRVVTSLEWSLKHQELLLTSFSKADDFNLNQRNGLIMLWSLALRKTPEFVFTSQAEITSAIFHTYNPKLIIGGTYTGQLLFWDTRGKPAPVMKTPLGIGGGNSGKTHSGPITCLGVVGSTNANHVISLSEGVLCTWSLANLTKPIKRIEMKRKTELKYDLVDVGALSMGLQQFETNNILVGSDDNNIYQVSLHSNNEATSNIVTTFTGHEGPIYSIDLHPGDHNNTANFSHLFISSSADWTTRLWTKTQSDAPLATFDANEDYVYCSKWCPTNASVIACGDGSGHLDIWDFNKDLEVPKYKYQLEKDVINKLSWSQDGKRLAVGDSTGKITILGLGKAIYNSKVEDSLKFEKLVTKMKMTK